MNYFCSFLAVLMQSLKQMELDDNFDYVFNFLLHSYFLERSSRL